MSCKKIPMNGFYFEYFYQPDPIVDLVRGFVLDRMNTPRYHDYAYDPSEQDSDEDVDLDVIREQLENSTDINEQADILQYLHKNR
jgi:hypothetical protein